MLRGPLLLGISFLAGFFVSSDAAAYPTYIGYGYSSCLTCHFNPYGNGPLTDYGRALSANAIADKPFFAANATDEELAEQSGFAGRPERLPQWIRPSVDFRGLLLTSSIQNTSRRFAAIPMQADLNVVLRTDEDKYFFSGTVGYIPDPRSGSSTAGKGALISREHYVGTRISDSWGVYAGFADVVYGIRTPDHVAFSRSKTNLAQNDQTHGAFVHYGVENFEAALHAFAGNLYQASSLRPAGASASFEVGKDLRVGASSLVSKSTYRKRNLAALHLRAAFAEGHGINAELGTIFEKASTNAQTKGLYLYVQSMNRVMRGLHVLGTAEFYTARAFQPDTRLYRFGPSLQWFPMQRVEFRTDVWTQLTDTSSGTTASLDLLGQLHLSF
jgi:hypothetical protein